MSRFQTHRCAWCHGLRQEQEMLEYRGKWFCGLIHNLAWERKHRAKTSRLKLTAVANDGDGEPPPASDS